jgi:hypothetical protein
MLTLANFDNYVRERLNFLVRSHSYSVFILVTAILHSDVHDHTILTLSAAPLENGSNFRKSPSSESTHPDPEGTAAKEGRCLILVTRGSKLTYAIMGRRVMSSAMFWTPRLHLPMSVNSSLFQN